MSAFGGLAMTIKISVIARSEAAFPFLSLRAWLCRQSGVAISVHEPSGSWTALAKPISFSNPWGWRMCWRSQSRSPTRGVGECVGEANLTTLSLRGAKRRSNLVFS